MQKKKKNVIIRKLIELLAEWVSLKLLIDSESIFILHFDCGRPTIEYRIDRRQDRAYSITSVDFSILMHFLANTKTCFFKRERRHQCICYYFFFSRKKKKKIAEVARNYLGGRRVLSSCHKKRGQLKLASHWRFILRRCMYRRTHIIYIVAYACIYV